MDFAVQIGLRVAASAALVASGALAGRSMAGSQRRRAEALHQLAGAVDALAHAMLARRLPLGDALSDPGCAAFGQAGRLVSAGHAPEAAWRAAYAGLSARGGPLDALRAEDARALATLFQGLGVGGAQAQRALLDEAGRTLAQLGEAAQKARDEQGRLYTTLGALTGMAAAVMLL